MDSNIGTAAATTHVTAPTQFVEAAGIQFAYRRFGAQSGTPLLFLQHFRGGMDNWDPAVTDGLAAQRPVILFDNAGVAASSGETPGRVEAQAEHAAKFLEALGVRECDVLGFSIGGYVAQAMTVKHPQLVRRLVLVGTKPRAGDDSERDPDVNRVATRHEHLILDDFLFLFFAPSATSQAAGRQFWERLHQRTVDVDPNTTVQTMRAQGAAIADWAQPRGEPYAELASIDQPVLVVNGSRDIMVPTINSYLLAQHLPNAELILYPNSGHGSLFQYPDLFVAHVSRFLGSDDPFS